MELHDWKDQEMLELPGRGEQQADGGGRSLPCVLQVLLPFHWKSIPLLAPVFFRDIKMIATGSEGGQIFV